MSAYPTLISSGHEHPLADPVHLHHARASIISGHAGRSWVALTSSATDSVKSLLPITVQGLLETGESVTLVNAQNHGGDGSFFLGAPRYKAHYAVLGDRHVSGVDQLLSAIRFRTQPCG
jgi:hypothetical protein